jgi:hypothetical protein
MKTRTRVAAGAGTFLEQAIADLSYDEGGRRSSKSARHARLSCDANRLTTPIDSLLSSSSITIEALGVTLGGSKGIMLSPIKTLDWEEQESGALYAFEGQVRIGFVAPRFEREGWVWLIESAIKDGQEKSGCHRTKDGARRELETVWFKYGRN